MLGMFVLFDPVPATASDDDPPSATAEAYPLTFKRMTVLCNKSPSDPGEAVPDVIEDVCDNVFPEIDRRVDVSNMFINLQESAPFTSFQQKEASALFNQSAILFGLTDFLIERAEIEAETFLSDRFTKDVCKEQNNGISGNELLPKTCSVFDTEDRSLTLLTGSGSVLRTTLLQDLRALPCTLPAAMYEKTGRFRGRNALVSVYLLGTVVEEMLNNEGLVASINSMPTPDRLGSEFTDIENATQVLPRQGPLSLPQRVYFASRVFQAFPIEDGGVTFPSEATQWENAIRATYVNIAY